VNVASHLRRKLAATPSANGTGHGAAVRNRTAEHAACLRRLGLAVCKPDKREKKPTYPEWGTRSLESRDFGAKDQLGVVCGPLSDGNKAGHALVIVDLDSPDALAKADEHLPATGMIEGRPGKTRSHRYYLVRSESVPEWAVSQADQSAAAALKKRGHRGPFKKSFRHSETKKIVIDFLGTGGQAVCPPSVHESGERREWTGGKPGKPAAVEFLDLWHRVCDLAAACGAKVPEVARDAPQSIPATPSRWLQSDKVRQASAYLKTIPAAVSGQGGHAQTMWAARVVCLGFDLGADDGFQLLRDDYNTRCSPPWSDSELRHKCIDADRLPFNRRRGWLLEDDSVDDEHKGNTDRPNLTDLGNAVRLVARHGHDIRWCEAWSKWIVWDGRRWKIDDTLEVHRRAQETVRAMYEEAKAEDDPDPDRRQALAKYAIASESANRLGQMIRCAASQHGIAIRPDQLDTDPWLLNVANGTLDLRTGKLRQYRRENLVTKLCPVEYHVDAKCPAFRKFGATILPDRGLRDFTQRFLGYALTGDVREDALALFYGEGANGKTTLLNAVADTIGPDYSGSCPPELLVIRRGERHPTELADLFGRRLVVAHETREGDALNESLVKQLTGRDKIKARRMREDFWDFNPTHKLILTTNHKPRVSASDHAIWRRLRLVPFDVRFWNPAAATEPGEKRPPELRQDKDLPTKLRSEAPGILAWLVRGCLRWQASGLGAPAAVQRATAGYRSEQDIIGAFVEERCETGSPKECRGAAGELYKCFRDYLENAGERHVSQRQFAAAMERKGFRRVTSNGVKYLGIDVKRKWATK
jgi:P4 family phage/plasmid primase-like protien